MNIELTGSMTEDAFRRELTASYENFRTSLQRQRLRETLSNVGYDITLCISIGGIPEQSSEIMTFYCHPDQILIIEELHENEQMPRIISKQSVQQYTHGKSKMHLIRLAVAADVLRQETRSAN